VELEQAVALAAIVVSIAALGLALVLGRRLARIRPSARASGFAGGGDASSLEVHRLVTEVAALREEVALLHAESGHAVQRLGLVRFDAFADMGGRLSFAAAMLDADGSGIVLSSINARHETRIYAKPVERGQSTYNLSDEESEAIRRALGPTVVRAPGVPG